MHFIYFSKLFASGLEGEKASEDVGLAWSKVERLRHCSLVLAQGMGSPVDLVWG